MSKKINITLPNCNETMPGFENLPVNNLDTLYSYSVDVINCEISHIFDAQHYWQMILTMLDKLKPKGCLILRLYNVKNICKLYYIDNIDTNLFLSIMSQIRNTNNIDEFMAFFAERKEAIISEYKNDNIISLITLIKS